MRFGPWYPLADAPGALPAGENVVQVRLASGLLDYPGGKSAMVWYAHAADARAALAAFAAGRDPAPLVARHLIEVPPATDLGAFCAKLRADFARRFGAHPAYES